MTWLMTNKKSGTTQFVTDNEKTYWKGTHFGKSLTFTPAPTPPRAATPEDVKPAPEPKQKTRKRRRQPGSKMPKDG